MYIYIYILEPPRALRARLGSSRHLHRKRSWGLSSLYNMGLLENANTYGKVFEAMNLSNQIKKSRRSGFAGSFMSRKKLKHIRQRSDLGRMRRSWGCLSGPAARKSKEQ